VAKKKRKRKHIIRDIKALLKEVDSGEFAVSGRDFGRGVSFLAEEVKKLL
jgi:hypothetical protein